MWPFLTEVSLNDAEEIVLYRTPANHNLLSPQLAREITNNIYKNVMDADLTDKQHDETMGKDMHCILTYSAKVRPNILRHASVPSVAQVSDMVHLILTPLSILNSFFLQIVKKGN